MDSKKKMTEAFRFAQGGLFAAADKADVGNVYQELEGQGVSMMSWADPFIPDASLPKHVEEAALEALRSRRAAHYTAPVGNPALKEELAKKLAAKNHLTVDPQRNILITPGSDSGLYFAMLPFLEQGDEVLIPAPSYPNNLLNVKIMGGVPVPVPLREENGYQLEEEALEARVSQRTKMVVLTHPNNPTTTVFDRRSLEMLSAFVIRHELILVCDQAFEDFCYENEMVTPAALPGMFERTVTVFSFSKGMGLSGLRVGYLVCCDRIMDSLYANAVSVLGATGTAAQEACLAALREPGFMEEYGRIFEERRRIAFEILNAVPGVSMQLPESGFLCWVNVSGLGDSGEIAAYLLREAKAAVNEGGNYGPGGEGHLRIVLGVYRDSARVEAALHRIAEALEAYRTKKKRC